LRSAGLNTRFYDLAHDNVSAAELLLSAEENKRANAFRFLKDRHRFILRHAYLRDVASSYLDATPSEVPLETLQNQRPQLPGSAKTADWQLSLSSSDNQVVVAVAKGRRVGVDIERIRPDADDINIAKRFFSKNEHAELEAMPASRRCAAFFRIWVRKEAFAKAIGLGLARDFRSFDVLPSDRDGTAKDHALIADHHRSEERVRWLVRDIPAPSCFALACCAEGDDWSITHRGDANAP